MAGGEDAHEDKLKHLNVNFKVLLIRLKDFIKQVLTVERFLLTKPNCRWSGSNFVWEEKSASGAPINAE